MSRPSERNDDDVVASESVLESLRKQSAPSTAIARKEEAGGLAEAGATTPAQRFLARMREQMMPRTKEESFVYGISLGGAVALSVQWWIGHTLKQGIGRLGTYLAPCILLFGATKLALAHYRKRLAGTHPTDSHELKNAIEKYVLEIGEFERKAKADLGPKLLLFEKMAADFASKQNPDDLDLKDNDFRIAAQSIAKTIQAELQTLQEQGKLLATQTTRATELWSAGYDGKEALTRFRELVLFVRKLKQFTGNALVRYHAEIAEYKEKEAANNSGS